MTPRDRTVLAVVAVLAVVLGGWLFFVSPERNKASSLQSQVAAAEARLSTARTQAASVHAAKGSFAGAYATLVRLGEAVPTDDDVPSLIYQIQSAATAAHVNFISLTLNGSSSSAASLPGAAAAGQLPPGVSVGPAGFPVEPFTFTFEGNFFHLASFFGRLDKFVVATNKALKVSGRLLTLNSIDLASGTGGFPQIMATVSATTYLLPASQGLTAGATPAGPAAGVPGVQPTSQSSTTPPVAAVTP